MHGRTYLSRKGSSSSAVHLDIGTRGAATLLPSAGQELALPIRESLGAAFGVDLSRIRVHAGSDGGQFASAAGARAATVGRHIAFAPGQFAPDTENGRRLLAHEVAHSVQQGLANIPAAEPLPVSGPADHDEREARAIASAMPACRTAPLVRAPVHIARDEPRRAGGTRVDSIEISIASNAIVFHAGGTLHRYGLQQSRLVPGTFQMSVAVSGNNVHLTPLAGSPPMRGRWAWRIRHGQENPATLLSGQQSVEVRITDQPLQAAPAMPSEAPAREEDPNAVSLSPEEAQRRCESNDLRVMTFPVRFTRLNAAYPIAQREGDRVRVRMPVHVLGNSYFRGQTRTLPTDAFAGGTLLEPNQIVRVHFYQPRLNPFDDDEQREQCMTGEDMLRLSEQGDRAIAINAALTALDAFPFTPAGQALSRLISAAGTRVTQRVVVPAVTATMIGTARAAPAALGGATSRAAITAVEQGVASQSVTAAGSQVIRQGMAQGATAAAAPILGGPARTGGQAALTRAGQALAVPAVNAAALDTLGQAARNVAVEPGVAAEGPVGSRTYRRPAPENEIVNPHAPASDLPSRRVVQQVEDVSCGPACAEMMAEHYGVRTTQQTMMQQPGYVRPRTPGVFDPEAGMATDAITAGLQRTAPVPGRRWITRRYSPTSAALRGRGEVVSQLRRAMRDGDGIAMVSMRRIPAPGVVDAEFHAVVVDALEQGFVIIRDPDGGLRRLAITEVGFGEFQWFGRAVVSVRR